MFNLDNITNENNKDQNNKWVYIPGHPYRMSIIGGSGSRKSKFIVESSKRTR